MFASRRRHGHTYVSMNVRTGTTETIDGEDDALRLNQLLSVHLACYRWKSAFSSRWAAAFYRGHLAEQFTRAAVHRGGANLRVKESMCV
ncbi:uncharacterized protein N7459_005467 [Penicillium hispanicum]|uniref:uncharacterized protein n=1 Tax=Penicillium hispanicum TaxID=1080232 RepID=UPI002541C939|nr:uncharacterized protein N7459_005467 [Penicillium hispanicum]KAJ5579482.1 hypothetical protein N7459_005467 [Penicillium hispanicum]